jgi:[NiFe] hydrogenase assembly HybE family chaperone
MDGATPLRAYDADPSDHLECVFERIGRERFAGVPLLNPALRVRAIGFEQGRHGWTGVMLTPWLMNLMILPAADVPWQALAVGSRRLLEFPAGRFEMLGGAEDALGPYLYCPMISAMSAFSDQESAEDIARELCARMKDPATAESVRRMNPTGTRWHLQPEPAPAGAASAGSRRDFLRGRFGPGNSPELPPRPLGD